MDPHMNYPCFPWIIVPRTSPRNPPRSNGDEQRSVAGRSNGDEQRKRAESQPSPARLALAGAMLGQPDAASSPRVTLADTSRARRLLALMQSGAGPATAAGTVGFTTAVSMAELNLDIRETLGGTVWAHPGRLSDLSILLCESGFYGAFLWALDA